jgi:uncharacterized protein with HEPN domain
MLDMARKACKLVAGKDRAAYDADETLRLALTHLVQVIGEAARHVSAEYAPPILRCPGQSSVAQYSSHSSCAYGR